MTTTPFMPPADEATPTRGADGHVEADPSRSLLPVLLPGEVVAGRYRIVRGLGQGGMGQVYEAFDLDLGQAVALKLIRPDLAKRQDMVERFKSEVRLARRVTHPNVCRVFDFSQELHGSTRLAFLTMELLSGGTLGQAITTHGLLGSTRALPILHQVASALDAAHRVGIVHGDLKPSNILFDDDSAPETRTDEPRVRAVVSDFGLATLIRRVGPNSADPPRGRHTMGTPKYMAPEQKSGSPASTRSDLYAFGVVACELLTGRRPEKGADPGGEKLDVEYVAPQVAGRLRSCLEEDPAQRPRSAAVLAEAFADAFSEWRPCVGASIPYRPNWSLVHRLGAGGFGEAWLVQHRKTHEERVVKFCFDGERLVALQREITLFRLLRTELGERDDISRIIDWNLQAAPYYIESEYTSGGDLLSWSKRRGGLSSIPRATLLDLIAQSADALAAAHSIGVLHTDIKPGNVLVDDRGPTPRVRLADFGVGRVLDRRRLELAGITAVGLTSEASVAGTELYLAPEIREGKTPTVQADIYALGVLLYQAAVKDFCRVLAPGWRREIDDDLLAADIEAAVDGVPERRPAARDLARSLRSLDARRATHREERRARARRLEERRQLASALRRWRVLGLALALATLVAAISIWTAHRVGREATRARDAALLVLAMNEMDKDPNQAAAALLEMENPGRQARSWMRRALNEQLVLYERTWPQPIHRLAIDPDGRRVAVAGLEGRIDLWEPAAGAESRPVALLGHSDTVVWLEFAQHADRLLSVGLDDAVRVWDLTTGGATVLSGHSDRVWRAYFDPQGNRVVTPSQDGTARVWHLDGRPPIVLRGHRHWVTDARFSPDGEKLVTASRDGTVRIWDAENSTSPLVLRGHESWVFEASFSPDGTRVVSASRDGTARIWSVEGDRRPQVLRGHEKSVTSADFLPRGQAGWDIVTASRDGTVRLWNSSRGESRVVARHGSVVTAEPIAGLESILVESPIAAKIVNLDGFGQPVRFLDHPSRSNATVNRSGQWLVTGAGNRARVWPTQPSPWGRVFAKTESSAESIAVSADGRWLAGGTADGLVYLWPIAGGPPVHLRGHRGSILALKFRPDGRQLASGSRDDTLRLWDLSTLQSRVLAGHEGTVGSVVYTADGKHILSSGFDGTIRRWSTDLAARGTGTVVAFGDLPLAIQGFTFGRTTLFGRDSKGRAFYVPGADRVGVAGTRPVRAVDAVPFETKCLQLDSTGRRLSAVRETRLEIWGTGSLQQGRLGNKQLEISIPSTGSGCGYFDPTGRFVVILARGTATVVDLSSKNPPVDLIGYDSRITDLDFLPDGSLVTSSHDGTIRTWRLGGDVEGALRASVRTCLDVKLRQDRLLESEAEARRGHSECVENRRIWH